jgi:hypothetical protein
MSASDRLKPVFLALVAADLHPRSALRLPLPGTRSSRCEEIARDDLGSVQEVGFEDGSEV